MGPRGGTTGPPGPEVEKGDPAVPNSGTNTTWAAMNGDHMGPVVRRWHRECTPRAGCAGCPHVGALRAALARRAPPPNARKSLGGPILKHLQGWISMVRTRMHLASCPNGACSRTVPAVHNSGQCAHNSQSVSHSRGQGNKRRNRPSHGQSGLEGRATAPIVGFRHAGGPQNRLDIWHAAGSPQPVPGQKRGTPKPLALAGGSTVWEGLPAKRKGGGWTHFWRASRRAARPAGENHHTGCSVASRAYAQHRQGSKGWKR